MTCCAKYPEYIAYMPCLPPWPCLLWSLPCSAWSLPCSGAWCGHASLVSTTLAMLCMELNCHALELGIFHTGHALHGACHALELGIFHPGHALELAMLWNLVSATLAMLWSLVSAPWTVLAQQKRKCVFHTESIMFTP